MAQGVGQPGKTKRGKFYKAKSNFKFVQNDGDPQAYVVTCPLVNFEENQKGT